MPNLKEILGASYDQVPEDLKKKYKDIDLVDSTNYVEKKELDTANETNNQYKKDIAKRDKDLLDLQGKVKDNGELSAEIETLKNANQKASEDYEAILTQIGFDSKFEKALGGYKTKNPKAIKALLDMEKVKLDGENFLGLEDQMKALKESDSYLFAEETPGGTGSLGGGAAGSFGKDGQEGGLGSRLAKEKAEAVKATDSQNNFFK
ncbi:phage scaffolding protein [Clostridium gasigenes]|uniref:Phage scaffolding protein n=1 Tax=Clostridium gasigenes TaxID=94869 RepID=A0A7X0SER7_9CLOT|nr:phage scaffolding protein [Clostridium gasigenes]MBB6716263.1 phage scaffolding protein [Clostridium gasigenes]